MGSRKKQTADLQRSASPSCVVPCSAHSSGRVLEVGFGGDTRRSDEPEVLCPLSSCLETSNNLKSKAKVQHPEDQNKHF